MKAPIIKIPALYIVTILCILVTIAGIKFQTMVCNYAHSQEVKYDP